MLGIVKLICALTAVAFPMAAGALATKAANNEVLVVILIVGSVFGSIGVFGFATVERTEEARRQARRIVLYRGQSLLKAEQRALQAQLDAAALEPADADPSTVVSFTTARVRRLEGAGDRP